MCLPMKVSWETNVSVTEYKKSCIYPDPCTSTVSELYEQNNKPFDVWKKKIQIASVSEFLTFVMNVF